MVRLRAVIVAICLAAAWPVEAGPDAAQSAAALADLKKELAVGTPVSDELSSKDFAAVALTKDDAETARQLLWKFYAEQVAQDRGGKIRDRLLMDGDLKMPFFTKTFGEKPAGGHSLWISLHGGGGAPPRVNDQQYENQQRLYQLEEGIYLVPRAPTNTWNLWHEGHIDRLFGRLIQDMIAIDGVDPDRVYVLGYSAGGDGVYQLAPRMADYWAAAAMMAGHPNDASPLGLRNVAFAIQVGALDAAFDRNRIAGEWGQLLDGLQKDDPGGYKHFLKIHEGKGHWMDLDDRAVLPWMAGFRRNPVPPRVVWKQAGTTHDEFYWLAVPEDAAKPGSLVDARIEGQTVEIVAAESIPRLLVRLDDRLLDLDKPVRVVHNKRVLFEGAAARTIAGLLETVASRGDPQLMFAAEVSVELNADATPQ